MRSDKGFLQAYWKILFVGEDKEKSIAQLIFVEHALEFFTSLDDTISIVGVDHEDDTLGILKVMSPKRSNLVLTTNIPHGELNVLVFDSFNVETCERRQFIEMVVWASAVPIVGMVVLRIISKLL